MTAYDNTNCRQHPPGRNWNRWADCTCVPVDEYVPDCADCEDEGTVGCPACDGTGVLDEDGDVDCRSCDAGSVPCECGAA